MFLIFLSRFPQDFEILHGDFLGLSDTSSFLKSLAGLDALVDSPTKTGKHTVRERKAAGRLFNWEVVFISCQTLLCNFICLTNPATCHPSFSTFTR